MPQNKTLNRVAHTLIQSYNIKYDQKPYETISYEIEGKEGKQKISSIYMNKILNKLILSYFKILDFKNKYKDSTFQTYLNLTRNIMKQRLGIPKR